MTSELAPLILMARLSLGEGRTIDNVLADLCTTAMNLHHETLAGFFAQAIMRQACPGWSATGGTESW
jgi:hypothetical protein